MSALLEHLHDRCEDIAQRVERLSHRCEQESLHRLRVDLKKLRAALRLLRAVDPDFPYKKMYVRYRRVFAQGGLVRELQLQLRLLASDTKADPAFVQQYSRHLQQQYAVARGGFRAMARTTKLLPWKRLAARLGPAEARCTPQRLDRYFLAMQTRIDQCLAAIGRCSAEELHDLRKALKDDEANRKLTTHYLHFDPGARATDRELEELIDKLGDWHDHLIAAQRLKADLLTSKWSPELRAAGTTLLQRWRRQCGRYRKELNVLGKQQLTKQAVPASR
ncbi:MAG: CHAD domain-containing protein [Myxococcales bacterium]|nr:CHAD domain-containing protein [Myxococcales bacterium]